MISPETMSGPSLEQALEWAQGITPRELSDAEALDLLPTPTATQPGGTAEQHLARKRGGKMNRTDPSVTDLRMALQSTDWAVYAKAIENGLTRVAAAPAAPAAAAAVAPRAARVSAVSPDWLTNSAAVRSVIGGSR